MKELETQSTLPPVDKQEIGQRKELAMIGRARKKKGMTLFCLYKGEITVPEYDESEVEIPHDGKPLVKKHKLTIIPGAFYIQALNKKNAERKFRKLGKM